MNRRSDVANQLVAIVLSALAVAARRRLPGRWRAERDPRRHPAGTARIGLAVGSVLVGAALVTGMALSTDLADQPPRARPVVLDPDAAAESGDPDVDDAAAVSWAAFDEVPPGRGGVVDAWSDVSW